MVGLAFMDNVKKCGLPGIYLIGILHISVQVQVAILMLLLAYKAFHNRAFGGKHVCYHLLGRWALRVCQEKSFTLKKELLGHHDEMMRFCESNIR